MMDRLVRHTEKLGHTLRTYETSNGRLEQRFLDPADPDKSLLVGKDSGAGIVTWTCSECGALHDVEPTTPDHGESWLATHLAPGHT